MPSLRELMLQKQQEEAAKQAEASKAKEIKPVEKSVAKQAPKPRVAKPKTVESPSQVSEHVITKDITIDTLRGLYWLATTEHVGDKKASRGQMKQRLNDLLLTKDGMRTLLKSLEEFVFS